MILYCAGTQTVKQHKEVTPTLKGLAKGGKLDLSKTSTNGSEIWLISNPAKSLINIRG